MWAYESVFYQIYPLGFCGAPYQNDGTAVNRLKKVVQWIPHLQSLQVNAVYFSPLFESDSHGYDTRDFQTVDRRLGTNETFTHVCSQLHAANIRVVLDGVFHHVGRGFWAFQDVLKNREASPYRDWFYIDFHGNSNYNDGLWYEGWEGHYDLVKLNLQNQEVVQHIFESIEKWVTQFNIDGLRLDVAYCIDKQFLSRLRSFCNTLKPDFFLLGEMIGGDYNTIVNEQMLHSATNYECYKGLYSSLNAKNMFELGHSLLRQFGPEQWTLYKGKHLFNFVDNHDVTRIASMLNTKEHLPLIYALLFAMPGIPCIYYGSEWGATGLKQKGQSDEPLRPSFPAPIEHTVTTWISSCAKAHRNSKALCYGNFDILLMTNLQLIFERQADDERIIVAVNIDQHPFDAHFNARAGCATDLLTNTKHDFGAGSKLAPYSAAYWKIE